MSESPGTRLVVLSDLDHKLTVAIGDVEELLL